MQDHCSELIMRDKSKPKQYMYQTNHSQAEVLKCHRYDVHNNVGYFSRHTWV
jgi:hypothetical protein